MDRAEVAKAYALQHGHPPPDVLLDAMMALLLDSQGRPGDDEGSPALENATIARAEYEAFAK